MIVIIFITSMLIVIALIAVLNALMFPRLSAATVTENAPRVSVLIPARNESKVIGQTVKMLLAQTYSNLEVIILDDHSDDETGNLAMKAANGDARLSVIEGNPLPTGWLGKNWACHQLAQAATNDILIFADADVRWSDGAIASIMQMMQQSQADLLTVWPTQETQTWAERLVVPMMALAIIGYLPLVAVHHMSLAAFAAACGQCLVFRRRAYDMVGGHAGVRDNIIEDVALARQIKLQGLRLRMTDGAGVVGCRMYTDWASVRNGFAKNILAGHGNSLLLLLLSTLFHWTVFVFPWLWLAFGAAGWGWPAWPLALIGLGVGVRALSAAVTQQRVLDAVLMPLSVLLMTVIAAQSVWWHWHGGPQWKGRVLGKADGEPLHLVANTRQYTVSSHKVGVKQ